MSLRRAGAAAATGLLLSATILFAGGPADASDSRTSRPPATAGRPAPARSAVSVADTGSRADNPAEIRVLLRSLGLPHNGSRGLTEWEPATASTIDGAGGSGALAARLMLEYSGAVPRAEVARVVRRVTRGLRRDHVASSRLLDVAEARCRRELTDLLAREVSRPPGV